jgi:N-acetylglucosamine-6-phosphate deacetylase
LSSVDLADASELHVVSRSGFGIDVAQWAEDMTDTVKDGFVDLQVNGYAGVDFNSDSLTAEDLRSACEQLQRDGVSGVLAAIITASAEQMTARIRRLVELREQVAVARGLIWGLHVEGPFISSESGYVGAHPQQHVQPADVELMRRLIDASQGQIRLVTLAPERDSDFKLTQFLAKQGIVVSAGHCDPTLDRLRGAIDAGLSMFTHLGNGCPAMLPRHDNIIQRVLSLSDRIWITFIADGAHMPFYVLGNFLKAVGFERAICVTDATAASRMGAGKFSLGGVDSVVGVDGVPRLASDPRYLAGSALTMPQVAMNLEQALKLSANQIGQLCKINPRRAIEQTSA